MFLDFTFSEIAVIGIVALIAIGPKDMPVAIRAVSSTIKKMRRMAGEFQHHVDEMMREADLQDVSSTLRDIRSLSVTNVINRTVDPDGSMSRSFDPFAEKRVPPVLTPPPVAEHDVPDHAVPENVAPPPAFIPPNTRPPPPIQPDLGPVPPSAFVPPSSAAASLQDDGA